MSLPPLPELAEALFRTTETLARELTRPTAAAPDWSDFDWRVARASAAMQGISALLCHRLRWQGPAGWRSFLAEQRAQTEARFQRIAALQSGIDVLARSRGVSVIALKGAALYALGFYPEASRPMGDIDLLVRDPDLQAATEILEGCGYAVAFDSYRHRVFKPRHSPSRSVHFGEHIDSPIKIELHTCVAEHLPVRTVDITGLLIPAQMHSGINAYPSHAALLMHLLLHAAGNMRARGLRFIQLHDIALLTASLSAPELDALLQAQLGGQGLWWGAAPLILTAKYFPESIPAELIAGLEKDCPNALRRVTRRQRLTDVSWSNVRIEAFPGIEWARGLAERCRFMQRRLWPSREARRELKLGAAQIVGGERISWYDIPHSARIARWLLSTPPRVQTVLSVQAAMAQES